MSDYRKFIKVIGMAVLIVAMVGGSVFAAEKVAVRTTSASSSSSSESGFGIWFPIHYLLPITIKDAATGEALGGSDITVGGMGLSDVALYSPDLLLGYKLPIGNDSLEPVVGLYYLTASDGTTASMLGFAAGAKYFHNFVKGSAGSVYGGGTALLQVATTSIKDNYDTTQFGLSLIGNVGVELIPFESLRKFSLTFDTGIPLFGLVSYGVKPDGGTTSTVTRINLLERLPVFSLGMHVYF